MPADYAALAGRIEAWSRALGFQQVGITDVDLGEHERYLGDWLARGYHGEMHYMAAHHTRRSRPAELVPGAIRVISARMDYLGPEPAIESTLADPNRAYVSRYALGRDYHKVIRLRLRDLSRRIEEHLAANGVTGYIARPFTDSAPLLEKALAQKAGLGWIGKNTLLLNRGAGSWFFLGELVTNLPLPVSEAGVTNHCGTCRACLDVCPTRAIVAPYRLDARRCISYLTIEHRGSIDASLRAAIGNRIFGCDDCQVVCPWNRYAGVTAERDFAPRHGLDTAGLLALFRWTEDEFLARTAGSAIRRTGYRGWLRNLSVALGNAPPDRNIIAALQARLQETTDPMLQEHYTWAIERQHARGEP